MNKVLGIVMLFFLLSPAAYAAEGQWAKASPNSQYISTVETTPWGIIAGEYDARLWLNPFNGLFISKDLGDSWTELELAERGVTDIYYSENKLYASTFYFVGGEAGLYVSSGTGQTFQHLGNNFSTSQVFISNENIILGTYSHGLWFSPDGGVTWEQKIGDGYTGPRIWEIKSSDNLVLATTDTQTYASYDSGNTWQLVPDLSNLRVRSIEIVQNAVFAGTNNTSGIYKSENSGAAWTKITSWGNRSAGALKYFDKKLFAGRKNLETNKFDVYVSKDFGSTWLQTDINSIYNEGLVLDLDGAYSQNKLIFSVVPFEGVFKYSIFPEPQYEGTFLEIPWNSSTYNELVDKVYSFFDHEYPQGLSEPYETSYATLNYLGIREAEPIFYYSGHKGYDFSLEYGTPVLASAGGLASYKYDSGGLGHYIEIDHLNNYKSIYGHLQSTGLFTNLQNVQIAAGEQVGIVGLSGNTNGPHLHFEIRKSFSPADPFGWQAKFDDPWKIISQTASNYLWNVIPEKIASLITSTKEIILGNKKLIIEQNSSEHNFTVFVEPYSLPKVPITQNKLAYISGTSFLINAYNILGQPIPPLFEPAIIEVDLSSADLENIRQNSLKIYFWNEQTKLWEPVPSFFDALTRKLTGTVDHFSQFAVFGEERTGLEDKVTVYSVSFSIG